MKAILEIQRTMSFNGTKDLFQLRIKISSRGGVIEDDLERQRTPTVNDEWERHEQREAYLGRAPFGCHVKSSGRSEHATSRSSQMVE